MNTARSKVGKFVADDLYVHREAVELLEEPLRPRIKRLIDVAPTRALERFNVVKLNLREPRQSLLAYEDFFEDPFPVLSESWTLSGEEMLDVAYRSYADSLNPPILHRKELLLPLQHPSHDDFSALTRTAEDLGLFENSSLIGFKQNWHSLIKSKGYQLSGGIFAPIGNDTRHISDENDSTDVRIFRHLTALTRSVLSAPMQLLAKHSLLTFETTVFDYGCGKGDDLATLRGLGYTATGWDPFFAPDESLRPADLVNLGFVLNVIEDESERRSALRKAFALTKQVLAVAVMLRTANVSGVPFRDGLRTCRGTFQKYFEQDELHHYLKQALGEEPILVAPGIAFVFRNKELEQRFISNRYRRRGLAHRIVSLSPARAQGRETQVTRSRDAISEDVRVLLETVWRSTLDLGRVPELDELPLAAELAEKVGSRGKIVRLLGQNFDSRQLESASRSRADDLRVFFAMQTFTKRPPYKHLEPRLQRDIKAFLHDYRSAQGAGMELLSAAGDPGQVRQDCMLAAESGMGWLDREGALHIHLSIVDRLPPALRVYVGCGLMVYGSAGNAQIAKIHASSGKLTLTEYEDFDSSPLPRLSRRTKINIRKLDYEVFEYGGKYEMPLLYFKSRYLNEEYPGYSRQEAFDTALRRLSLFDPDSYGVPANELPVLLESRRWKIEGFDLSRSTTTPDLNQPCGANFSYRDLVDCGETQQRLKLPNRPCQPETYNALCDLCRMLIDPIIEYFGSVRLTYCFSSLPLSRQIGARIAPRLDQHAACELDGKGNLICDRGGAACDFIVDDEDMEGVARWIIGNLPFDRLYFYDRDRPLHVSYADPPQALAYEMTRSASGRRTPRPMRN
ncbi:peptidase m15a [Caballeronia megalochromosomata]|nr:peptidase m15a [Caballeronia megalochromosomata]